MFLHVSVCPQGGGGVPGQVPPWTRYTPGPGTSPRTRLPPRQVHPLYQVSPRLGTPSWTRYTPKQVHPQAGTPPRTSAPPGPGTPPGRYTPWTRYTPWVGTPLDQVHPQYQIPSQQMATAVDGTHLTGMHSCSFLIHIAYSSDLLPILESSSCAQLTFDVGYWQELTHGH